MSDITLIQDTLLQHIEQYKSTYFSPGNSLWLEEKENAYKLLQTQGLPHKKEEKYKYADIPSILHKHSKANIPHTLPTLNLDDYFHCNVPDLAQLNLIVLNGIYHNEQEQLTVLPNGIIMGSLHAAMTQHSDLVKPYLSRIKRGDTDSLMAANTVLARDGIFIYVPTGTRMEDPVQIINIMLAEEDTNAYYRNLIILEDESQANVINCSHTLSLQKFLSSNLTDIFVGDGAHLSYTNLQNEHIHASHFTHTYVNQEANSETMFHYISLNGGFIRNNLEANMLGEHSSFTTEGLSVAEKEQLFDNHIVIKHLAPHCNSNQLYKSILEGNAGVNFNGRIFVDQQAQKTNAFQSNKSLLLSGEAKSNSKPQLEIYADDVKCSHGATVGKIDQEAFFYLKSRGIGEKEARHLLMYAFANEVIKDINSEKLRKRISEITETRLRGELSQCQCCALNCQEKTTT